ncbi:unnamed protein product [Eruca vesicaria subsp. sativa]|uniref:Squalene monooxygenase n=1 Tax=Eruca vesicaria subsp. sativa TaxID=29727 RepID=A0ABC8KZV6_ERUVS|nr:unnamed protein product [Eruca vesicaria subsp. sativa]
MASPYLWLWTVLAFLLTWTSLYIANQSKKKPKLTDLEVEERRDDGGADVIIVGAGVGGSALAYALAKDGRKVHVIEKDMREPERVMGEIMQPGGRLMLAKLGLQGLLPSTSYVNCLSFIMSLITCIDIQLDCLEGIDEQKVTGLALYKDGKKTILPFPVDNNNFPHEPSARSFHNGRFVQRLCQKASSHFNVRLEEGTVKSLIEEKGVIKGVTYKTSSGEETTALAPLTVVCDGCYSRLRRSLNDNNAKVLSFVIGYISKNCRLEEPDTIHLIMSKPSFTLLYQNSSAEVRCFTEISPDNVPSISKGEMTTFFKKTVAPQIPPKLREILMKGINEGAKMDVVATKNMSAILGDKKGVIVLGDAFNMRHPVIASGMMVLLSDILILRRLLKPLRNFSDFNKVSAVLKSFYNIRKPMSSTVDTLGSAFFQILVASTDEAKEAMRQGFFDYHCGGGFAKSDTMALLGGMNPRPLCLIRQLLSIILFSVGTLLYPFPSPLRIWRSLKLLWLSWRMLGPRLKAEGVRQMLSPANAAAYRKNFMGANTF